MAADAENHTELWNTTDTDKYESAGDSCILTHALVQPLKGLLGIYDRYTSKLEPNGQNAVIHLFRRIIY